MLGIAKTSTICGLAFGEGEVAEHATKMVQAIDSSDEVMIRQFIVICINLGRRTTTEASQMGSTRML